MREFTATDYLKPRKEGGSVVLVVTKVLPKDYKIVTVEQIAQGKKSGGRYVDLRVRKVA